MFNLDLNVTSTAMEVFNWNSLLNAPTKCIIKANFNLIISVFLVQQKSLAKETIKFNYVIRGL